MAISNFRYRNLLRRRLLVFALAVLVLAVGLDARAQRRQVGTAPWTGADTPWPAGDAAAAGFDTARLEAAARLAGSTHADALLILRHGRLVFERYWNDRGPEDVQQTYSTTKGALALLVGRVLERGDIESLDQPIVDFVPELAGQGRSALTFRNVMAMESGLAQWPALDREDAAAGRSQLEAVLARGTTHDPYEYFIYNSAAYRLLFTALERATGLSLPDLTRDELFAPLGMTGAYWVEIRSDDRLLGYQSIRMRPRDAAKVGQVLLDDGRWNGDRYLPAAFIAQLRTAPAPDANPSYGLFWHLNAGDYYLSYRESNFVRSRLLPGTPPTPSPTSATAGRSSSSFRAWISSGCGPAARFPATSGSPTAPSPDSPPPSPLASQRAEARRRGAADAPAMAGSARRSATHHAPREGGTSETQREGPPSLALHCAMAG